MSFLVISSSLHPQSRSRILAGKAVAALERLGVETEYVDLRDLELPICDGGACYEMGDVQRIERAIRSAEGILVSTPIYNYGPSSSAKNLVELTGSAWSDKVVGFLCAAGGRTSYMAVMSLANSLMLDFRAVVLPRFLYTDESMFHGETIVDPAIEKRLEQLAATLVRFGRSLNAGGEPANR